VTRVDPLRDAFGLMLLDHLEGRPAVEIVERDDGFVQVFTGSPAGYFAPVRRWHAPERRALRLVRGRVLDVGCGAGRVALELQRRGHKVVGIDPSPLAVEVCRRRGVADARVLGLRDVDESLGRFDTVVLFGNNFGLLGDARKARTRLRRLRGVTNEGARVLAASGDPHATRNPAHLAYLERNVRRGRLAGQIRFRVRHRRAATPYFDFLFVSREEMGELADAGGWRLIRTVDDDGDGASYVGVLEKA
jgi:SAM-dependent methyltransferase